MAEEPALQGHGETGSSVRALIHSTWNEIVVFDNQSDLRVAIALAVHASAKTNSKLKILALQ